MPNSKFECEIMDWNLFYNLSKLLAKKINNFNYKPNLIIGLARGGWVLARVLCDFLGVKDLISLAIEHWGVTATPDGKAKLKYPFKMDLAGKKVLVVDDITDTGESLQIAVNYIASLKPNEIKTATIRNIKGSKFVPDYYAEEITWRWVIFPWNYTEDMCNLISQVLSHKEVDQNIKQIKSKLKQNFKIVVEENKIKEILEDLKQREV